MFWNCSREDGCLDARRSTRLMARWPGYAVANVDDEKTKLLANALDRASTTCLALGVIAPLAAAFYAVQPSQRTGSLSLIFGTLIWLGAAITLHMSARWVLNRLSP
jgi:hypothetical protein